MITKKGFKRADNIKDRLAFTERALMVLVEDINRLKKMTDRTHVQVHALAREHNVHCGTL